MTSRFVLPIADVGAGIAPSSGAQLFFYETGTTTPKNTYSDSAGTIPNANPVVANSLGQFPDIFIIGTYKVVLKNSAGVQAWAADPVDEYLILSDISAFGGSLLTTVVNSGTIQEGQSYTITDRAYGVFDVVLASGVTPNTFNIVACVGVPTLALVLRIGSIYNVKQFGAVGNGVANDTSAIQSCFDFIDTQGGGAVWFPPGTYMISASEGVRVGGRSLVQGVKGKSILKRIAATGSKIIMVAYNYALSGTAPSQSVSNVTIRDLSFYGDAGAAGTNDSQYLHGLDVRKAKNVLVEGCEFRDCPGDGIIVRHQCQDVTIVNNTFDGSVGWARTRSQFPTAATVRNAISVLGVDKITIRNNTIIDWGLAAAIDFEQDDSSLGNLDNVTIDNNHMTSSTLHFRGIQIAPQPGGLTTDRTGKNIHITNNTVLNTSDFGIYVSPRTTTGTLLYEDVVIQGNIVKNTYSAIVCQGIGRLTVANNSISGTTVNPTARCIRVTDCRDNTTINNNIIGQSNFTKIEVNNSQATVVKNVSVNGNIISDTTATSGTAIDINGYFSPASVVGNTINTKITGIQVRGTSSGQFVNSTISGNNVISEGYCIFTADWCKHTTIDGNSLQYTLGSGGALLDSANLTSGGGINFGCNTLIDETGNKVSYEDMVPALNKINNHRLPNYNEGIQSVTLTSTALSVLCPYVRVAAGGFTINSMGSLNRVVHIIANGALTITHNATTLKLKGGVNATLADGDVITLMRKPDLNIVELSRSF